jgi:radical SAM protein (TIGR04043 family)/putative N-acetyltransferase (TIGR04045 family)
VPGLGGAAAPDQSRAATASNGPGPDLPFPPEFRGAVMTTQLQKYLALQSQGAKADGIEADRKGGAGPSDAKTLLIEGHPLTIPILEPSATDSPYTLTAGNGDWLLEKQGHALCRAQSLPAPRFYQGQTGDGIPYHHIARRHGADTLASTVVQECFRYNDPRTRCRFCAIGASLDRGTTIHTKTPEQLAEVALAAQALDGIRHVTLTSGTTEDFDSGALYLGRCAEAVKQATGLPVEIQFEPLRDKTIYARLKAMGVDDVGIHIESFDPEVRRRMTPGKAATSVEAYFQAFTEAVAVFGRNKVSTYVILGLGEDEALTLECCEAAAALGVYPFVVPLRPLPDSYLANTAAPDPAYLFRMVTAVGKMLDAHGLSSSASTAGCVRCRACSPLQFIEGESIAPAPAPHEVELSIAGTAEQLAEYYQVRREIFVLEQGVFQDSDKDAHDDEGIPIIALVDGRVAGTVRCYPSGDGVWYGGRLAVRKDYRVGFDLGVLLVKKAVQIMEARKDVKRFLATIQIQNVRFFQRLGWSCLEESSLISGHKHQTMEKKLHEAQP